MSDHLNKNQHSGLREELRKRPVGAAVLDTWDVLQKHNLTHYEGIQVLALTLHRINKKTDSEASLIFLEIMDRLSEMKGGGK